MAPANRGQGPPPRSDTLERKRTTMNSALRRTFITAALLALAGCAIQAPPGGLSGGIHGGPGRGFHAPQLRFDALYRHNHYYPALGFVVVSLPLGSISVRFQSSNYFFGSGVWYRPSGSRFVVVLPPVGIVVPVLPPAYVTLRVGGRPYYYANGVYYTPAVAGGYAVVPAPTGDDAVQPQAQMSRPASAPVFYPRQGQSAAQTEAERQECNRWATTQPEAMADASVFQRAVAACMDARGYSVR